MNFNELLGLVKFLIPIGIILSILKFLALKCWVLKCYIKLDIIRFDDFIAADDRNKLKSFKLEKISF